MSPSDLASFTSPGPELLRFGPFSLRWYGLLIAFAVTIGLNLSSHLARHRGLKNETISDLLPTLVLASIIGARAYYVVFEWRNYNSAWMEVFAVWNGGIAIHGALIGGVLAIILFCRLQNQPFWDILDVLVPSLALGQSIGRWGNFFNSEAFGLPTNLPWKLFIPYSSRPLAFTNEHFFHPTFLYESLWDLCIFLVLLFMFRLGISGRLWLPAGALSCTYLVTYSLGRFWIEKLRIDPLCLGGIPPFCEGGLRIAQLMSLALIALSTLGLWWLYGRRRSLPGPRHVDAK
ncbi:prolipoprotein diacylglyceryl transferase [cyanobiont of Ornithocercus magnificus]|nr:prolipoprotein diacylglyceryl transferase [cyanobiont of Ornithocercus magnificus]